ncbi:MAG: hypothetical protein V4582_11615 [Pseudomonadota bacterium]
MRDATICFPQENAAPNSQCVASRRQPLYSFVLELLRGTMARDAEILPRRGQLATYNARFELSLRQRKATMTRTCLYSNAF